MSNPSKSLAVAPLLAALAACGGFQPFDASTGTIAGRIRGADPAGAQVYVLGKPELASVVASDGSFQIEAVPVGEQSVVLVDGHGGAALRTVKVVSQSPAVIDASDLPPAAQILVGVTLAGGAQAAKAQVTVEGTVFAGIQLGASASATLGPLPAGRYAVHAWVNGYLERAAAVSLAEGETRPLAVELEIASDSDHPGCAAEDAAACGQGLVCDPADGACYPCVQDSDCAQGESCSEHQCLASAGIGGSCAGCHEAEDCRSGYSCVVAPGASLGYCSQLCLVSEDCPAGYACSNGSCTVEQSCLALLTTFGQTCVDDDACGGLYGGTCLRSEEGASGYCTAPCSSAEECPSLLGFHCDLARELCVK